jgi:3-oxoacyl-[acyl-carrier-protein] synthase-3
VRFKNTGIKRTPTHYRGEDTTVMGVKAATIAIERAGVAKEDIDFVVFLQ